MEVLKTTCDLVDDFVSSGSSSDIAGSREFWNTLGKDHSSAQTYTECLIYKYIALSCGLGNKSLFPNLTQIKNICAPSESRDGSNPSPISGPRHSGSSKSKHVTGNHEQNDIKSTPKRKFNISRRRSDDSKKNKKESEVGEFRRKNSKTMSKSTQSLESCEQQDDKIDHQNATDRHNVLLTLNYVSKMCDMAKWDFTKLRDVFLTWNKARGWEQTSSNYEYMIMKRFSAFPSTSSNNEERLRKVTNDVFSSVIKPSDEFSFADDRHVRNKWRRRAKKNAGEHFVRKLLETHCQSDERLEETLIWTVSLLNKQQCMKQLFGFGELQEVGASVNYWEVRHKILTRPEQSVAVIQCLTQVAKKVIDHGDESKILPTLHIFCETLIMSPHTPLEVLQECYTTFEQFYIWPTDVAHPVREVLDMIHMEMKSPGHFYRMIFLQDCELTLPMHLSAKMPSSETFVLIDSDLAETESLCEAFKKLGSSQAENAQLSGDVEKQRFLIKHIFESVFGSACCDMVTLDQMLRALSDDVIREKCYEALLIMEEASMKSNHRNAQDYLRSELEIFSDTLANLSEGLTEADNDKSDGQKSNQGNRRVTVIYENCRSRDSSASFSGKLPPSPIRNNSSLRRNTYSMSPSENKASPKKFSTLSSDSLAEFIGSKVITKTFTQADISDSLYNLVRDTAKNYVQEKKLGARHSFSRKDSRLLDEDQDAYRDSGVIDDDDPSTDEKYSANVAAGSKINCGDNSENSTEKRSTVTETNSDENDARDDFWKEFLEKGFDTDNEELSKLLSTMSFDQRKSFFFEHKQQEKKQRESISDQSSCASSNNLHPSPDKKSTDDVTESLSQVPKISTPLENVIITEPSPPTVKATFEQKTMMVTRRRSSKTEHKTLNRISRFVRPKKKAGKKGHSEGEFSSISSSDSVTSLSSLTTSEDINLDGSSLRVRTSSETKITKRKKGKFETVSYRSPKSSRDKLRHTLGTDILPSPMNLSVRSLPSRERLSIFGNDLLVESKLSSSNRQDSSDSDKLTGSRNSLNRTQSAGTDSDSQKRLSYGSMGKQDENYLFVVDDDETRRRIDSGIGPDGEQDVTRRRTASSYSQNKEHQDLGIGGVKFALKEVMRASRRGRVSVSDDLEERTVYKKVLKLIFVGNDKTVGHLSRAYYDLRKRLMSRAPLFQHVDLRIFFIPVSANNCTAKDDILSGIHPTTCDVRVGELLGKYDPWYHTVVALSVNNLMRIYPKITSSDDGDGAESPAKSLSSRRILSPQEVIASALLSYSRFAVSRTDMSMFKINMISSSGDTYTDIFCFELQIGHDAYKTAVKSGRYGKLGKLVDLSNDTGPPPAYMKIAYSQWGMDGQIVSTREIDESFYHTVSVIPMSLLKADFRGTDVLQLLLIDNEKRQKLARRTPNANHSLVELAELVGSVWKIGSMKLEVVRPVQGTFALTLDDTKIYTNIKSIEVGPCFAPGAESFERRARNVSRRLRDDHLIKLPLQTFWPVKQ